MLRRERMYPASFSLVSGSNQTLYISPKTLGHGQAISSLNDGTRPPGYSCNPVTMFKYSAQSHSGSTKPEKAWGTDFQSMNGNIAGYLARGAPITPGEPLIPDWSLAMAQEVLNKSRAQISDADLELGVMLGELRETLEGLRNPAAAARKFLRKAYSLGIRRSGGKDWMNAGTGSWMEGRYGWYPLYKSIQDILQHVEQQLRKIDGKIHSKRSKSGLSETTDKFSGYQMPGGFSCEYTVFTKTVEQYFASTSFTYLRPPTTSERYGMSFLDIPSIAWELVSKSFALDWFLSIGTWLSALKTEICDRFNVLGSSVSRRITVTQLLTVDRILLYGVVPVDIEGPLYYELVTDVLERRCYNEEFTAVLPAPNSTVFSVYRTLDALSLLWQTLPKR